MTSATAVAADSTPLLDPNGVSKRDPDSALSISVEARIEPARVRVEQQAVLTVRVGAAGALPTGRLHDPRIRGARVLPLGEDRHVETVDGSDIGFYERRFSVFPTAPGKLNIPPLQFDAWRTAGGAPVRHESKALSLSVDPALVPSDDTDRRWLPARSLSLVEAGPPAVRLAPGQTLERMITLRADGIMAEDLPAIPLAIPFPLRIRDDPPRLWNERTPDGVVGYRSERILIGAAEDGVYQLAGTAIDWWNTRTERWEQATLPAWTLTVAAFASANRRPAATWNRPPPVTDRNDDAGSAAPAATADAELPRSLWTRTRPWLWAIAAMIALLLLGMRARRRRRERAPAAAPTPVDASPVVEVAAEAAIADAAMHVDQAYRRADAGAAREALLAWGKLVWPRSVPANLAQLAMRVEPPLRDDIRLLEKAFFSPAPIDWTRPPVAERLEAAAEAAGDQPTRSNV